MNVGVIVVAVVVAFLFGCVVGAAGLTALAAAFGGPSDDSSPTLGGDDDH